MQTSPPLAIDWRYSPWLLAGRIAITALAVVALGILPLSLPLRLPLMLLLVLLMAWLAWREPRAPRRALWHADGRFEQVHPEPARELSVVASTVMGALISLRLRDASSGRHEDWLFVPGSCHPDLMREIRWRALHLAGPRAEGL